MIIKLTIPAKVGIVFREYILKDKTMRFLYFVLSLLFAINAIAHEAHTKKSSSNLAISVAMDTQGKLWRASVKDGFVLVDASSDMGKTFSAPVKVNTTAQKLARKVRRALRL